MDWHDDLYYGDSDADMVNGTKPRNGTSYAYQYMTASLLVEGIRLVVHVTPIKSKGVLLD